jgi:hypothetical protein
VRMMGPGADPDHSTAPHHLIGAVIP